MKHVLTVALFVLAVVTPSLGDTIVPGDALGFNGGLSSLSREAPRVMQTFIDDDFLATITEPVIFTSIAFRLPASATTFYPLNNDISFGRWDLQLAKPSAAAAGADGLTALTFADNMVDVVMVRSGPLTIPQDAFSPDETDPNHLGFTFDIAFTTPYTYTPGDDIVLMMRHNGHGDTPTVQTRWNFDSFANPTTPAPVASPWGSLVATGNVDATGTTAGLGFASVNKFRFTYIPEPTTLVLTLCGFLLRRR